MGEPDKFEMQIATRSDGVRFLFVAGLASGREWELLDIIAKMRAEDRARQPLPENDPAESSPPPDGRMPGRGG